MNTFVLHLECATRYERIEGVTHFVGEDLSGSFGILPGHERLMSLLKFGMARFRVGEESWEYVAAPGALVYFVNNQLHLSTRRYLRGRDFDSIQAALEQQFRAEEEEMRVLKQSLRNLEREMLKRLVEMKRGPSS